MENNNSLPFLDVNVNRNASKYSKILKNIFHQFVDRCIATFFTKSYEKKVIVHAVPKLDLLVVLPFLGTVS